jgi:hypothetical protein
VTRSVSPLKLVEFLCRPQAFAQMNTSSQISVLKGIERKQHLPTSLLLNHINPSQSHVAGKSLFSLIIRSLHPSACIYVHWFYPTRSCVVLVVIASQYIHIYACKLAPPDSMASISAAVHDMRWKRAGSSERSKYSPLPASTRPRDVPGAPPMWPPTMDE